MPPLSRREFWFAGLLFLLLSLAAVPTFAAGLACSDDILPHLYRSVQFDLNWRHGRPFLQWAPDLMRGYGYPIFAFYAPLTYVLVQLAHLLGPDLGTVYQWAFWAALPVAGWGMYVWARAYCGRGGAFVAGVAYTFAPYLLYNVTIRGALPEGLAMAFLPWVLYTAERATSRPTRRTVATAAMALALLILTHNVVALFALPLLVLLGGVPSTEKELGYGRWVWPTATLITAALGLTLFFWLPIAAELRYTQSALPDPYFADWPTYAYHVLPVDKIIAWPDHPADPNLLNPSRLRTLGVGQALLAAVGLLFLWAHPHKRRRWQLAGLAGTAVFCLYALTPASGWLWELGLKAIQLPPRFLVPLSLIAALLAGVGVEGVAARLRGRVVPTLLWVSMGAAVVAASGWPWLYPLTCPVEMAPSQYGLVTITTWQRIIASAQGELLPRWVHAYPPQEGLTAQYEPNAADPTLLIHADRLQREAGLTAERTTADPAHDVYTLAATTPLTLTYQSFYFPGWQVWVDGVPQPITPSEPYGFIQFTVPAGSHTAEIAFTRTPVRQITLWLSAAVALGLLIFVLWPAPPPPISSTVSPAAPLPLWRLLLPTAALLLLKFGVLERINNPIHANRYDPATQQLADVAVPHHIPFADQFLYLGYTAPATVRPGEQIPLWQYWTPLTEIGAPYQFGVRVADEAGRVWNTPEENRPYEYIFYPGPQNAWQVGHYAADGYILNLLPGTPPGDYWLEVTAFRRDTSFALTPQGALPFGTAADPAYVRVGRVQVVANAHAPLPTAAQSFTTVWRPTAVAGTGTLLGWSLSTVSLRPGDEVSLDALWEVAGTAASHAITLQDAAGQVWATEPYALPPTAAGLWREQSGWLLPPPLPTGAYDVHLAGVPLGQVQVVAPERTFDPPLASHPIGAAGVLPLADLVGYTPSAETTPAGAGWTITLFWRVTAETTTNYRVFVHLLDETGAVVAQADEEPAQWTRPTRGWLTGEYITDRHDIWLPPTIPTGVYTLITGLYDPATGVRLGQVALGQLAVDE